MSLPFVGVDGEGGNITDEYGFTTHTYTMLRVGNQYTTGPGWLWFLHNQPKKRIHVAYMFDYDVTMMMRHHHPDLLKSLVASEPTRIGAYEILYRPRKEFTIRAYGRQTTINDVFTFFQCKFITTLQRWEVGTADQLDKIGEGKDARGDFGALTPQTIAYNQLECELLAEVMDKFRRACIAIDVLPQRWQGPGQLAKALLRKHGIPKTELLPEPNLAGVWTAAQAAYYGGRFETSAVGPVRGPVDGWDINSAYPHAITTLPCLEHVTWYPTREIVPEGLYNVEYTHRKLGQVWYGLPHRTSDGAIRYPRNGGGWYWGVEILSALALGARFNVRQGFAYRQECQHQRFDFMHRLYSVRKAIGKSTAGHALKLAMNSVYGVLAQSVGKPPYANPIYAGLITAKTRARLNHELALSPRDVYMCATDGIYAAPGLPLTESPELGGWERTHYPDGMHIVMPGIYFAGNTTSKTRGVPDTAVNQHKAELIAAYQGKRTDHIEIPLRQFIGLRAAVARNRLDLAGQWVEEPHLLSYNWGSKRIPDILIRGDVADRTVPYKQGRILESTPYDRIIGGNMLRHLDGMEIVADGPDWAETLTEI